MNRPGFWRLHCLKEWSYKDATELFPEVIDRAVRMVSEAGSEFPSQRAARVIALYTS
jgi:hypothetical protein